MSYVLSKTNHSNQFVRSKMIVKFRKMLTCASKAHAKDAKIEIFIFHLSYSMFLIVIDREKVLGF
jgi:hypothetical protein